MSGAPWTEEEERVIIEGVKRPARDIALELGRSLWAVRQRRMRLRRWGLLPDIGEADR